MEFIKLMQEKGRPLSEMNPGSDELALPVECALQVVKLLTDTGCPIFGGDIISERAGMLRYAYQIWGQKYHTLNWSCEEQSHESDIDYARRSYKKAIESIIYANNIATELGQKCFIVLVLPNQALQSH